MNTQQMSRILLILAGCLLVASCEEEPPVINLGGSDDADTSYVRDDYSEISPQDKAIIMDYFTGVRCVNCPAAMEEAKALKNNRDEEIVITSHHPNTNFNEPHLSSAYDFRLTESDQLFTGFGRGGMPRSSVDRIEQDGSSGILQTSGHWPSMFNEASQFSTPLNIDIHTIRESGADEYSVTVEIIYLEQGTENNYLTVLLKESGFIDYQQIPNGWQEEYSHDYVVRKLLTPYNGVLLNEDNQPGRLYRRNFSLPVDIIENPENAKIVAFVHHRGDKRRVIHVQTAQVQE